MKKPKLTTFIEESITPEQQSDQGFEKVLTFLPKLYAACQRISLTADDAPKVQRISTYDEYMLPRGINERYEFAQEAFKKARRSEFSLWRTRDSKIGAIISFYKKGSERFAYIRITYNLETCEIEDGDEVTINM